MNRRDAFTLIELLVVVSIIAALAAMLLPAIKTVRESAKRGACMVNVRNLALATIAYTNDNEGFMPNAGNFNASASGDWTVSPSMVAVLAYLDITASNNAKLTRAVRCPANPTGNMYGAWGGVPSDVPMTLNRLMDATKRNLTPGGLPALWADLAFRYDGGNGRHFANSCGHKGRYNSPTSGEPLGGNVARGDGSVVWAPYGNLTQDRVTYVVNGGTIGGTLALPTCAVWWRIGGAPGVLDTANTPNLLIGNRSLTWNGANF